MGWLVRFVFGTEDEEDDGLVGNIRYEQKLIRECDGTLGSADAHPMARFFAGERKRSAENRLRSLLHALRNENREAEVRRSMSASRRGTEHGNPHDPRSGYRPANIWRRVFG